MTIDAFMLLTGGAARLSGIDIVLLLGGAAAIFVVMRGVSKASAAPRDQRPPSHESAAAQTADHEPDEDFLQRVADAEIDERKVGER